MSAAADPATAPAVPAADASAPAPAPAATPAAGGIGGAWSAATGGVSSAAGAVGGVFTSGASQVMNCSQWLYANIASKLKSFIQLLIALGLVIAIAIYVVQYSASSSTCVNAIPAASIAVFAALCLIILSTLFDLCLEGKKTEGENVCVSVWRHLQISLLAWGIVLATLAWLGYELGANGMYANMRGPSPTFCSPHLWTGMALIFIVLLAIFVFYALLLLVVVIIACATGGKKAAKDENGKPVAGGAVETTALKVWQTVLNFFGLDELADMPAAAAPPPGAKAPAAAADGADAKLLA